MKKEIVSIILGFILILTKVILSALAIISNDFNIHDLLFCCLGSFSIGIFVMAMIAVIFLKKGGVFNNPRFTPE